MAIRPEESEYTLEVDNLNVEFRTPSGVVHAVSDVSFRLRPGEVLGIVGESGSGKTVTANAVMRLLPETAKVTGSIKMRGRNLLKMRPREFNKIRGKDISMIFQDPMTSLNPVYTVGNQMIETLALHMGMHGETARRRAVELLDLVSIPQPDLRLKQYPHEFSGGMRQRVMIAMALSCNPSILIADEPTTALDVTIQAQILELIKELRNRVSASIILITHDLGIIADLCDNVNVMYGSHIMESGALDDIFYETAHPYTKGLLQCLPERAILEGRSKLEPIQGAPVDLMMMPVGCVFASRCDSCMNLCLTRKPELHTVADGHSSYCWESMLGIGGGGERTAGGGEATRE